MEGANRNERPFEGAKGEGNAAMERGELRRAGGVDYTLTRKRVKNLNLRLERSGEVVLTVPLRCPAEQADAVSDNVVERALRSIQNGASIVTDTQMAKAGINKKRLAQYGGEVYCFMSDEDVARMAKENGTTRASACMDKAAALYRDGRNGRMQNGEQERGLIFAIGNAPTALVRLYELINEGKITPELIIAAPVGFVNVVQSKELILTLKDIPYIVARGRKGGSNIAACICNSLLYML